MQLAMMMEHGLLMTPENLVIPKNERAKNHAAPKTEFRQTRACFTLVERDELLRVDKRRTRQGELQAHSNLFGRFAIGLDPIRARELGAVPAIYFYRDLPNTNLTQEMLFRLRELRSLAIALARLEAKAKILGRDTLDVAALDKVGHLLEGEPVVEKRIAEVGTQAARAAVDLLDTDRVPAWNLVDWINILLKFFQTADSHATSGSLAYYQQKEWRIVQLFGPHVQCYRLGSDRTLDGEYAISDSDWRQLRERLQYLNSDFFTDDRLEGSALLTGTEDEPFFDFIEEILCPSTVASRVASLLETARIDERYKREFAGGDMTVFVRRAG